MARLRDRSTPGGEQPPPTATDDLLSEAGKRKLSAAEADVGQSRERMRRRRLTTLALVLAVPLVWLWTRLLTGDGVDLLGLSLPHIDPLLLMPALFFLALIVLLLGTTIGAGRSPHVTYRPEQITTRLDDVIGIDVIKEDVVRSLNLFLAHKRFAAQMGGTPRRGLLFEGAPGTGKTYLAKAMAREAEVPFLFVSATSFQSMYYGATARKIRSFFKAVRKAARQEGGAIAFIEEIDAIGMARGGLSASPLPAELRSQQAPDCGGLVGLPTGYAPPTGTVRQASMTSEGVGGVVNELLVQLQSFDEPSGWQKLRTRFIDRINLYLPPHRALTRPTPPVTNVLVIAATNRADNLDPALLRPGRFDRRLTFEPPTKRGRSELIDHFLKQKAHEPDVSTEEARDSLASVTQGWTPVMIEHLFDEALVNAVRRGADRMCWKDVEQARLVEEVGLGQPVAYTAHEKRLIATHEAGHAVTAHLVAPQRRLEVLTIIKRRDALGMLAHGDADDVFTRSRTEMLALIQIAMGGQVAEEIFFGDVSTGPAGDLRYATDIAAQMVGAAGMTDTLVSLQAIQGSAFSDTNMVGRVLADAPGRERVEQILQEQKRRTSGLLIQHRHLVEALRDALLDRHELIGREITDVLAAAGAVVDLRESAGVATATMLPARAALPDAWA
ncbi:MAG TPA: AAA family ATPase [Candidatus Nanopelagicales bacterium]|jgi:ATP-dependent Zn protease|nr:AAA family ATPase [Candidatus Nanopelagicales bacterium]